MRDLIAQLKFHLSKFNEEQKESEAQKPTALVQQKCDPKCLAGNKQESSCQADFLEEADPNHSTDGSQVHQTCQCEEPAPDMDLLINQCKFSKASSLTIS